MPVEPDATNTWDCMDKWLLQMAMNATVEGGLVLTLTGWRINVIPEGFLPGFREVGKINTDFTGPC